MAPCDTVWKARGRTATPSIQPRREYRWTPTESQGGAYHFVTIKVTDGYGASSHGVFGIGVNEVNTAPYLDGMPRLGTDEHSLLTFPVSASDPDLPANILTYRLSGAPPGAAINRIDNTSGNFTWTPHEGQDGSSSFVIVVSDGEGGLFSDAPLPLTSVK